ncbi:MAG: BatA domain-containing protein [Planctomycetaceae bacterium]
MTFLAPAVLLALPAVALPILIHLVNDRRFQTVDWGAMRFLLAARKMARGFSRVRRWLILLLRTLAVAAAVVAVARPLSRGWLSAVAGERGGAIVILDRSPSMQEAAEAGGDSKLAAARRAVADALETMGTGRVVLVDSVSARPLELASPAALREIPEGEPAANTADLPRLLQVACDHLDADATAGSLWICSDQRAGDWRPAAGDWPGIRERLVTGKRPVRVNLLAAVDSSPENRAVRVVRTAYEPTGQGWELFLDIAVSRPVDSGPVRVPVGIELGGARSTVEVDLTGTGAVLRRHAIPVDPAALAATAAEGSGERTAGWGRVSIPADTNLADNEAFFTFAKAPPRRTIVVAEDAAVRRVLELAAGIPRERLLESLAEVIDPALAAAIQLDGAALLLWQAPLPEGELAARIDAFVRDGGRVIFLPPADPGAATFAGVGWGGWADHSPPLRPAGWRTDEGLLAGTGSGASLPVGELEVRRVCGIVGEGTALATLPGDVPLLLRASAEDAGVFFLATTPGPRDSDLASGGVVLYALLQRAIDDGMERLRSARQADAGAGRRRPEGDAAPAASGAAERGWRQLAGAPAPSNEAGFHAGVFDAAGRLVAVNRPAAEDDPAVVPDDEVERLFAGVPLERFRQRAGAAANIVEEVWRTFLVAVLLALAAEGILSLPAPVPPREGGP